MNELLFLCYVAFLQKHSKILLHQTWGSRVFFAALPRLVCTAETTRQTSYTVNQCRDVAHHALAMEYTSYCDLSALYAHGQFLYRLIHLALYFVAFCMLRSISEYFVILVYAVTWALCVRYITVALLLFVVHVNYICYSCIPFTAYPGRDRRVCFAFIQIYALVE